MSTHFALLGLLVLGQQAGDAAGPRSVRFLHEPVGCMSGGRTPLIKTRIDPAEAVAEGRLYFYSSANPQRLFVHLEQSSGAFQAPLPAYPASVEAVSYWFWVRTRGGDVVESPEFKLLVVRPGENCPEGRLRADIGPPEEPKLYDAVTGTRAFVLEAKKKLPPPPLALRQQLGFSEQVIVAAVIGIAEAEPGWRYCLDVGRGGRREQKPRDPTKRVTSAIEAAGVTVLPVSKCSTRDALLPGYSYLHLDAIEWLGDSEAEVGFQRFVPDSMSGVGGSVRCRRAGGLWMQDGEVRVSAFIN